MTPEWHWGEGNKYALEGMKVLLLLNGGAAVALMTFLGHLPQTDRDAAIRLAGWSLLAFGIGALLAGFVFFCAYMTQLWYGNQALLDGPAKFKGKAKSWHNATYLVFLASVAAFLAGLLFAWLAIGTGTVHLM